MWVIHLKNGKTLTSDECCPHEVPQDEITSCERISETKSGNLVTSIMKSDVLTDFFVKTSANKPMQMFGGQAAPVIIDERILGAFIPPQDTPVRLELITEPGTGRVKLRAIKVAKEYRKDGL